MKKDNSKTICVRLHQELYDYIKSYSDKEFTTVSGYITKIILEHKNKKESIEK